jgi:hypothetical protein
MIDNDDIFDRSILHRSRKFEKGYRPQDYKTFPFYSKFGCVYFVKSNAFIKIGSSRNLYNRLINLKISNAQLELLGIHIREDHIRLESSLHKQFVGYHSRGEWFHHNQELVDYIELNMNDYDRLGFPLYREFLTNNSRVISERQKRFLKEIREIEEAEWIKS